MIKRRKGRGLGVRIDSKIVLKKYKGNYLEFLKNIQDDDEYLEKTWELMNALLDPQEIQTVAEMIREKAGPEYDKHMENADPADLMEHLIYLVINKKVDHRKGRVVLARQIIAQMSSSSHPLIRDEDNPFLTHLTRHLKLTPVEVELLQGLYLMSCTRHLQWMKMEPDSMSDYFSLISSFLAMDSYQIGRMLSPSAKLVSSGIVELSDDHAYLSSNVVSAISGNISVQDYHQDCFTQDENPSFPLSSFDIEVETLEIMKGLMTPEGPCNILFYGKPGSGKTELARAIITAVNKQALIVAPKMQNQKDHRINRVAYASYFAQDKVIVVDEAELLLNTGMYLPFTPNDSGISKSLLNTFFDESTSKVIWIVNDSDRIHESTLRRFQFKLKFDKLSRGQREHAIDLILKKHGQMPLRQQKFITDLVNDETVTPGVLDNVMQGYARILKSPTDLTAERIIPRLIASHKNTYNDDKGLSAGDERYNPDVLNMSGDPAFVMSAARAFSVSHMEKGGGINFLLHGLPGTGKTEFVKYVARETGCDIVFKRGSDLLSMWLGGTEKQIAAAFREAEDRHAILLVDEADTFFQPRESAQRSWEVSQTNEFLNQMENHSTMLFCCTNLIDKLDSAAMRRFHFKLEFRAMLREKRASFFTGYFKSLLADEPSHGELDSALAGLNTLTPGDFRAVMQRLRFRSGAGMPWRELVSELVTEGSYKKESQGRAVGFER